MPEILLQSIQLKECSRILLHRLFEVWIPLDQWKNCLERENVMAVAVQDNHWKNTKELLHLRYYKLFQSHHDRLFSSTQTATARAPTFFSQMHWSSLRKQMFFNQGMKFLFFSDSDSEPIPIPRLLDWYNSDLNASTFRIWIHSKHRIRKSFEFRCFEFQYGFPLSNFFCNFR